MRSLGPRLGEQCNHFEGSTEGGISFLVVITVISLFVENNEVLGGKDLFRTKTIWREGLCFVPTSDTDVRETPIL